MIFDGGGGVKIRIVGGSKFEICRGVEIIVVGGQHFWNIGISLDFGLSSYVFLWGECPVYPLSLIFFKFIPYLFINLSLFFSSNSSLIPYFFQIYPLSPIFFNLSLIPYIFFIPYFFPLLIFFPFISLIPYLFIFFHIYHLSLKAAVPPLQTYPWYIRHMHTTCL